MGFVEIRESGRNEDLNLDSEGPSRKAELQPGSRCEQEGGRPYDVRAVVREVRRSTPLQDDFIHLQSP